MTTATARAGRPAHGAEADGAFRHSYAKDEGRLVGGLSRIGGEDGEIVDLVLLDRRTDRVCRRFEDRCLGADDNRFLQTADSQHEIDRDVLPDM